MSQEERLKYLGGFQDYVFYVDTSSLEAGKIWAGTDC